MQILGVAQRKRRYDQHHCEKHLLHLTYLGQVTLAAQPTYHRGPSMELKELPWLRVGSWLDWSSDK